MRWQDIDNNFKNEFNNSQYRLNTQTMVYSAGLANSWKMQVQTHAPKVAWLVIVYYDITAWILLNTLLY